MTVDELVKIIKDEKMCGFRYQIEGHHHYRDRFTVYCDGRIYFDRFCWGESAGLVYSAWVKSIQPNGDIIWDEKTIYQGLIEKLPKAITSISETVLEVDKGYYKWPLDEKLKKDKQNGYGTIKMLFMK